MKRVAVVCAFALLVSGGLLAQGTPNDVGVPAQNGASLPPASNTEGVAPNCPPAGPIADAFTGANVQSGRIFRDATASACPGKAYPGIFNVGTMYNFETYTYSNTSAATSCVTINFDPNSGATPCGTNAHASAYLGSYDPNNQAANFVGDVGSSVTQPFSFDVPANTDMVLVVTNTSAAAICDYSFEVVNLPCTIVLPQPNPLEVPVLGSTGLVLLVTLLAAAGAFFLLRRRSA